MTTNQSIKSHPSHLGFYRLNQILELIPIGRSTWWKWIADGKAPQGIKLGSKTTVWKTEVIHALIAQLAEEQEG